MERDLQTNGPMIFNAAAEPVKRNLTNLCDHLKTAMEEKIAGIMDKILVDYTNATSERDVTKDTKIAQDRVALLLGGLDGLFENALQVNTESSTADGDASAEVKSE